MKLFKIMINKYSKLMNLFAKKILENQFLMIIKFKLKTLLKKPLDHILHL